MHNKKLPKSLFQGTWQFLYAKNANPWKYSDAWHFFLICIMTPRGIEPLIPAWEASVLTAWPWSRFSYLYIIKHLFLICKYKFWNHYFFWDKRKYIALFLFPFYNNNKREQPPQVVDLGVLNNCPHIRSKTGAVIFYACLCRQAV